MRDRGKEAERGQGKRQGEGKGRRRGKKVTEKERLREKGIYCKRDKCQRRGEVVGWWVGHVGGKRS